MNTGVASSALPVLVRREVGTPKLIAYRALICSTFNMGSYRVVLFLRLSHSTGNCLVYRPRNLVQVGLELVKRNHMMYVLLFYTLVPAAGGVGDGQKRGHIMLLLFYGPLHLVQVGSELAKRNHNRHYCCSTDPCT